MALSRKFLKAMGLTEEQIDSAIEAHRETVDGLQKSLAAAEGKAAKYDSVEKELNELKTANADDKGYKAKYDAEHKAFEKFKSEIAAKESKTAKEAAVKAYFESKGITGNNLTIAMRGVGKEIESVEVEDGKIKDPKELDALVEGDYAGLVSTVSTIGAETPHPPANMGGHSMTREQIMNITDDVARQTAIAENHDMFGF